jgi:FAD/FMN-containing dehydrogenase
VSFDGKSGLLEAEAGLLLKDIQETFVTRGWLLPVTPGTAFVTLGGAVANDIHGKNHHSAGTFGEHVRAITLVTSNGKTHRLKPSDELFKATIGGLGLTGLITTVQLQLKRVPGPWIDAETKAFKNLDEFFELSKRDESEYSVAWVDCLSKDVRGLYTSGEHSRSQKVSKPSKPLNLPFTPPFSLINRATLPMLNLCYYLLGKATAGRKTVNFSKFFYPLDAITNWNRAYGKQGFLQHQCVIPLATARETLPLLFQAIRKAGAGSLLAVLKTTGKRNHPGLMTFPLEGVTLALDFTNTKRNRALLAELDAIVVRAGGRINPSKDETQSRETFEAGYPNLKKFKKLIDPKISSALKSRLIERQK